MRSGSQTEMTRIRVTGGLSTAIWPWSEGWLGTMPSRRGQCKPSFSDGGVAAVLLRESEDYVARAELQPAN
jgi:hypothetical protein